ncbi:RhoGAP domain family protein [Aspergillus niger]|uniref:RhoGAP domain family protein n=1 Tax=Aspergillus niger TaxID=5061 RepID=A0A505I0E9_ASPNG|nr:RhoGAP domain family protein [Aspergillus niger]
MASASNGGTPLPEEVSKPPEGVVLPPKDIRAIVEKTAGYVARNGVVFEDRVREKERNNPKFSFLNPGDAYAPFYQWRLVEIKEGRGTAVAAGRPGEATPAAEPEKPKGPEEPPEFHFSARMPIINAQDLEVVKLTALFVAKRGKSFMTALSQRETRNFQFDFLRPQHSLYQFFTRLVDQYTILLRSEGIDAATTEKKRLADLERNVQNKFHIDWHDFVVVETVLFTEADDQVDLPPPTSLNDLQSASLEQKAMMSLNPLRIEEAMPTEEETPTYYNAYPQQQPEPIIPAGPAYPPQGLPPQQPIVPPPMSTAAQEEEQYIRERMEAREQAAAAKAAAIPVGELEQHMRIELLDPRWKEQRAKAESRSATTNLFTVDVVNNLKRLASQRSDVFDSAAMPGSGAVDPEEEARRKKMAVEGAVPGSGPVPPPVVGPAGAPPNPQSMNIEEQIRRIHERQAMTRK